MKVALVLEGPVCADQEPDLPGQGSCPSVRWRVRRHIQIALGSLFLPKIVSVLPIWVRQGWGSYGEQRCAVPNRISWTRVIIELSEFLLLLAWAAGDWWEHPVPSFSQRQLGG